MVLPIYCFYYFGGIFTFYYGAMHPDSLLVEQFHSNLNTAGLSQ